MMQKIMRIFPIQPWIVILGFAVMLSACTPKVDQSEIIIRDNMAYRKGTEDLFTGIVMGKGREGYRSETCTFEKRFKDGVLDGKSEYWYPNGKLESVVPYQMGEIHGIVTRYYENGKIKARMHFVNGMRGGSKGETFWDEDGHQIKG
ncbi:MAG: hypothetical protein P8X55_01400 [Desulfosarcinaceae bacterium]|jgi:hypothetical protein